jgi:uncharacterized protein YdaL
VEQKPLKKRSVFRKAIRVGELNILIMKKTITFICTSLLIMSLNSCITMTSVSIADVKSSTGSEVNGSASGMGFLHLVVPKGLAEKATYELKNKGAVGNVSTTLTMREWGGIVQFYRVTAKGTTESK